MPALENYKDFAQVRAHDAREFLPGEMSADESKQVETLANIIAECSDRASWFKWVTIIVTRRCLTIVPWCE